MTRPKKPEFVEKRAISEANIVTGIHLVRILLTVGRVREVWIRESAKGARLDDLISEVNRQNVFMLEKPQKEFDACVTRGANHQGVLAFATLQEMQSENCLPILLEGRKNPLILVLDGVTDPHNFGACLRSAEAFGVICVIVPKDNSAPLNQVARKTSSGASELIPVVRVINLARCLRQLQKSGFWVIGATSESTDELDTGFDNAPLVLVMGSEGSGLRRLTREVCDELVSIPMIGKVESLNVSVATAILLYNLQSRRASFDASYSQGER